MRIETKTIIHFDKQDIVSFNLWKKEHNYSLRKIGKEIGISSTYIDDMVKGRRALNDKFKNWLIDKKFMIIIGD